MDNSIIQYKELIDKFTTVYPNYRKILYREIFWSKDLFSMDNEDMRNFIVDEVCGKSKSIKYLKDNFNVLSNFSEWCIEKGIIKSNPFKKYYDVRVFTMYMVEKMEIKYLKEVDIEHIIDKLNQDNKLLFELLIRGFYEGIEDAADFIRLKQTDINFTSGYIVIDNIKKYMSVKFFSCLKRYIEEYNIFTFIDGRVTKFFTFEDYILKSSNQLDEFYIYYRSMQKAIKRYFARITEEANQSILLSAEQLFISGFINFTKEKCNMLGKDDFYFVNLFRIEEENKYFTNDLILFWREYGMKINSNRTDRIRYRCFPYIIKSDIMNAPNK